MVLVVVEVFEFAVLDFVEEDGDLVGMELADHLGLLLAVGLHSRINL